jgi:hypothetical protein
MLLRAAPILLALLFAAVAGLNPVLRPRSGETNAVTAIQNCAQPGAAVQGGCLPLQPASLGSTPGTHLSHSVLKAACHEADLHVVRFIPAGERTPLVAAFCR